MSKFNNYLIKMPTKHLNAIFNLVLFNDEGGWPMKRKILLKARIKETAVLLIFLLAGRWSTGSTAATASTASFSAPA